jgi:hypothetical protein
VRCVEHGLPRIGEHLLGRCEGLEQNVGVHALAQQLTLERVDPVFFVLIFRAMADVIDFDAASVDVIREIVDIDVVFLGHLNRWHGAFSDVLQQLVLVSVIPDVAILELFANNTPLAGDMVSYRSDGRSVLVIREREKSI